MSVRKRITLKKRKLGDDDVAEEIAYWRRRPLRERLARTYELSREAYGLAGSDAARPKAARVFEALGRFGAPLSGLTPGDFEEPGVVFQVGVAPSRIDVLTSLTGLEFEEAWPRRKRKHYGEIPVWVLSEADLIRNKRTLGRARDLADVEEMEKIPPSAKRKR